MRTIASPSSGRAARILRSAIDTSGPDSGNGRRRNAARPSYNVRGCVCFPARLGPGSQWPIDFGAVRSEEHTSELQSLMRSSYAVFCLKKKNQETSRKKHMKYKHICKNRIQSTYIIIQKHQDIKQLNITNI